jgi:tRNA G18 (ribose-2'-O)-methylase SpoU
MSADLGIATDGRPFNILDSYRNVPIEEIKKNVEQNSYPYVIMLMNIKDEHNAGNLIRTAVLCGARKVIIFGRRKINVRGCVGAQNYINIEKVNAIRDADKRNFEDISRLNDVDNILDEQIFINFILDNDYLPIFIEQDRFSKPATNLEIKSILQRAKLINKVPCFILGNERFGIPKNILNTRTQCELSYTLELKQMGCIRSHNVSSCGAILCYKIMETYDELLNV